MVNLTEIYNIGENDCGYRFAVGKLGNKWHGFTVGEHEHDMSKHLGEI